MKSVTQIREQLIELTENVESSSDVRKLTALVRAGLFDPNKLTMLKRALNKENIKMTKAERDALLELLDRLLNVVMANQGTFMKVKQSISEATHEDLTEAVKAGTKTDIDITQVPPIIVMKRKAIRVFPDGQKVALYWADRINKYISVPFQSIGISEEVQLDEISPELAQRAYAKRMGRATTSAEADDEDEYYNHLIKAQKTANRIDKKETAKKYAKGTGKVADIMARKETKKAAEIANRDTTGKISGDYKKILAKTGSKASAAGGALGIALGKKLFAGKAIKSTPAKVMRESKFKGKLGELRKQKDMEEGVLDWADNAADIAVPYYSAGKKLFKGDFKGAAVDAAIDTALLAATPETLGGAWAGRMATKGAIKGAEKLAVRGAEKAAEKGATRAAERAAEKEAEKAAEKGATKAAEKEVETAAAKSTKKTSKLSRAARLASLGGAAMFGLGGSSGSKDGGSSNGDTSKSAGDPAFGGKAIQGTDSFSKRSGPSANDARMRSLQTAVNRSMTGRSTAVSEETLNENPALLALARLAPMLGRAGATAAAAEGATAAATRTAARGGLRSLTSKTGRRALGRAALDAMAGGDSDGGGSDKGSSSSDSNTKSSTSFDTPFKGTNVQGTDSFSKKGGSASAEATRQQKMQTAVNRSMTGRSTAVSENTINRLKVIAETRQPQMVEFADGTSLDVSRIMATKLVETYDAMNKDNKKLFLEMINKDKASFMKLFKFASKQ